LATRWPGRCASRLALLLFGTSMTAMAVMRPDVYPPLVEAGHFVLLACMLPAFALVMGRLSQVRRRLTAQRAELARALSQLQAIATRDELTGLPNRRQMLALMDLDHFKHINARHGHTAGDAVLLPDTVMPPALTGMERLREQTAALSVEVGAGERVSVTISVGLTSHRRGETLAQTLERAGRLLYQAKAEGRNRTVSASGQPAPEWANGPGLQDRHDCRGVRGDSSTELPHLRRRDPAASAQPAAPDGGPLP
jgi:GGDEF domain-containing protein